MHTPPFTSAAILAWLAQAGAAQNINTNTTITASTFVGATTSDSYPPSGSKW